MHFAIKFHVIQSASILVILGVASTAHAQCNSSAIGYALVGHVYRNFSAPSPLDCYSTCKQEEPKCRSFNFHADKDMCELSKRSKESRPADLQISELAVYFHSCYRDRLGSKPSLAANSCAEIITDEDSTGDGWYWLRTDESENQTTKVFCNMANGGNMASSFDLIFPPIRNISNYVMMDAITVALNQFTVSLWLKTTEKTLVPISYAVGRQMNSILIFMDETGMLRFLVADKQIDGFTGTLDDDRWHHVCTTWESQTGHAQVFIDGLLTINKTDIHTNGQIAAGGKLALGQDQDTIGGGFDVLQSFVGELAHVYLWDTALTPEIIMDMARVCKEFPYPGHVVEWANFGANLHGEVTRRNISRCHYEPLLV
ncbi:hypothetical protein QZH41_011554 [Actinostola sp. cb2023]|nr:hypothetical protein QZH41_011554 [Actinostola sp. cb2023]